MKSEEEERSGYDGKGEEHCAEQVGEGIEA